MKNTVALLVFASATAFGFSSARADRDEHHRRDHVEIFVDAHYAGAMQELHEGAYDLNAISIGNDALSSLRVPPGWVVVLFSDAGFQGNVRAYTHDTAFVGEEWNDKTSSIVVSRIAD